jgi:hypothetical protein
MLGSANKIGQWHWVYGLLLLALTIGLGFFAQQSDFPAIASFYAAFFLLYWWIIRNISDRAEIRKFIIWAVLLRFVLIFTLPNLSDDVYRFIWDGRLIINGYNPFDHLPTYYIENNLNIPGITPKLFAKLNSPEYFTIYPPIAQATFAIACWIFPNSILGSAIVMKLFLFCFEIGSIRLIVKILDLFDFPPKQVLIYALNPLIIIEITGNLHFEGGMIFFLLLALYWLFKHKYYQSAVAMALSIASKLLPLIFLPLLIRRIGLRNATYYFLITGGVLVLLFFPIFSGTFVENFSSSLDLYFRKFEFNASVYYLARWIGYQQVGYNMIAYIGPSLALGTLLGICAMALFEKTLSFQQLFVKMLFAISLYLLFTTTVHPWYASLPLVLCLFTNFRYPALWSFLITLTYINYSYNPYLENLWVVAMEYSIVFIVFVYEFLAMRKSSFSPASS